MEKDFKRIKLVFKVSLVSFIILLICLVGVFSFAQTNESLSNDFNIPTILTTIILFICSIVITVMRRDLRKRYGSEAVDQIKGIYIFSKLMIVLQVLAALAGIAFMVFLFWALSNM